MKEMKHYDYDDYERKTKAYFKKYASAKSKRSKLYEFKLALLAKRLREQSKVLDAGCGNGDFSIPAARKARAVYAVDFSSEMLAELRERARKAGAKNVKTFKRDLAKLGFQNGFFDLAFSFSTVYYIREQERTIKEIARVLKPGGLFVVDVGNARSLGAWYYRKRYPVPQFFLTLDAYQKLLERAGFEVIEEHCFEAVPRVNLPLLPKILDLNAGGRLFDELVSSLPLIKRFSFRRILVCRKTREKKHEHD